MSASFHVIFLLCCFICYCTCSSNYTDFDITDEFIPEQCDQIATAGDHLLLEYDIVFANGTKGAALKEPLQLYHILLDLSDDSPVASALKGMCKNATRAISWSNPSKIDLRPLFVKASSGQLSDGLTITIRVVHITDADNYRIFDYLKSGNISAALDMIDEHKGVNAVDEWGQTTLMTAVQMKSLEIISSLLNTRRPRVNVNMAKSSGFTAVFYAVELPTPAILSALLRKGASPNAVIASESGQGNTPLHYACMLEKTKHAELLLEYGAQPDARNVHGKVPLQLLPVDAVRSTKLYFKKMFEDAMAKIAAASIASIDVSRNENSEL